MKGKTMVLGIDGGSWNLIKPWIKSGKLPNFKNKMGNGSYANLRSSIPFQTFPAWKCYSTGKKKEKLGVCGFTTLDEEKGEVSPNFSGDFKGKEIWDYLNEEDLKSAVINMPTTYPPKEINGYMISQSIGDIGDFTYPPSLEEKLKQYNYNMVPMKKITEEGGEEEFKEIINSRFDVAEDLIGEVDFLHLTVFVIDEAQHKIWENKEKLFRLWKVVDDRLGDIDEAENIIVMSDHGFKKKISPTFHINQFFIEKGYLEVENELTIPQILNSLGLNRSRLKKILSALGLYDYAKKHIPRNKRRAIPLRENEGRRINDIVGSIKSYKAIGCGQLVVKCKEDKKEEIKKELLNITHPETGENICKGCSEMGSKLVFEMKDGYAISLSIGKNVWDETEVEGWHRRNGIFVASGPDFKNKGEIETRDIYDIAPTVLHLYGLPIPEDMDGEVMTEIMESERDVESKMKEERIKEIEI